MKSRACALSLAFAATLPSVLAWGNLGHETIAYIAQNFGMKPFLNVQALKTDAVGSDE